MTATWLLGLFGRKSDGEHDAHGVASHAGSDQHSASAGGVAVSPNVQGLASSHYDPTGFSQLIVSTEGGLAADEHTNRQGLENEHNSDASGQWSGYIARPADGGHAWRQAFKQAADMVSQMTLEEKVSRTMTACLQCGGQISRSTSPPPSGGRAPPIRAACLVSTSRACALTMVVSAHDTSRSGQGWTGART